MVATVDDVLLEYSKLIDEYSASILPHLNKTLETKRQPYNDLIKRLFDLYIISSFIADKKYFVGEPKVKPLVVLYCKSSLSLFSIYTCLQNGLLSDSAVLLRSILENLLNVSLLLQTDVDERLKLYDDFDVVEQRNAIQRIKQSGQKNVLSELEVQQIEFQYNIIKSNYHPNKPYHWAWKIFQPELKGNNPTIKKIADKVDKLTDYDNVYSNMSIVAHASPSCIRYIEQNGKICLSPNYERKFICTLVPLAIVYHAQLIQAIFKFLNTDKSQDLLLLTTAFCVSTDNDALKFL